jgi:5-methylcytosine-specific restriction endonuclease McrA
MKTCALSRNLVIIAMFFLSTNKEQTYKLSNIWELCLQCNASMWYPEIA